MPHKTPTIYRAHQSTEHGELPETGHRQNPASVLLLVFLSIFGALYYLSFLFNKSHMGDTLPYIIVLLSESFIVLQALLVTWTIIIGDRDPRDHNYIQSQNELVSNLSPQPQIVLGNGEQKHFTLNKKPISVDVFITTYQEPLEVIEKTARAAKAMIGFHQTYILDDGEQKKVHQLANELGINYITRSDHTGAKAGNINNALSQTKADYFVIFDADHVPKQNFLIETLPFFTDPAVAFVQTPQHFGNMNNPIARGAGFAQLVFYELIQRGKNRFNAAFCVGTNVVFRRTAIDVAGGLYQGSNSEDIWTSLLLHEHGYRSIYINNVLAEGNAPETIKGYLKQQLRWSTGAFEIFIHRNPLFSKFLDIDQKIQYWLTSVFYFNGLILFVLLLLPTVYIFFGQIPIVGSSLFDWAIHYVAFYGIQIIIASYLMKGFRWETIVMSMISFPVYVKAFTNVLFGKQEGWNITGRTDQDSPLNYVIPQLLLLSFLVLSTLVGLTNVADYGDVLLAVLWNSLNIVIFGYFILIALQEHFSNNQPKQTPKLKARYGAS